MSDDILDKLIEEKNKLNEIKAKLNDVETTYPEINKDLEVIEKTLNTVKEHFETGKGKDASEQISQLNAQISELEAKVKDLEEDKLRMTEKHRDFTQKHQEKMTDAKKENDTLKDKLKQAGVLVDENASDVDKLKIQSENIKTKQIELKNKVGSLAVKSLALLGFFAGGYWVINGIANWISHRKGGS